MTDNLEREQGKAAAKWENKAPSIPSPPQPHKTKALRKQELFYQFMQQR